GPMAAGHCGAWVLSRAVPIQAASLSDPIWPGGLPGSYLVRIKGRCPTMSKPRLKYYLGLSMSGFHRLAYREWGPAEAQRVLVCVHGLTRNGRDFEEVAAAASQEGWRVI